MPKIHPQMLNCVVYLYKDHVDAKTGSNFGGTGFLISFDKSEHYVVTNWHVAVSDGASIIRINTYSGTPDIIETDPSDWIFDPKYDIAILPVLIDPDNHQVTMIDIKAFVTETLFTKEEIGPGDDVFMIGRFVDHDGKETNRPAVRFGNISINPFPFKNSNGKISAIFCIDMHSRTGFSGSPVFVYRTPGYNLVPQERTMILTDRPVLIALLGIHYGQFPERWNISTNTFQTGDIALMGSEKYIDGLSGMTCVLPAWNIIEVLHDLKLTDRRKNLSNISK